MKKVIYKINFLIVVLIALSSFATVAFAQTTPAIQTNSASNVQSNSATLNANITNLGSSASPTVWFQWGTTTSYGNETPQQTQASTGSFSQNVAGLNNNTTYHFRIAGQNRYGIIYGQDMTFTTGQSTGSATVQTNSATDVSSYQATLNGNLSIPYISNSNYVYFQWGTTTSYGNQTNQQTINSGSFSQSITGLNSNTTYHFRAAAQGSYGTIYGQDMTFYSSNSGSYSSATLTANKRVINLSARNLNWQPSMNANPGDILSFAITLQAGSQDIHNVAIRDVLQSGIIYKGNLTINASINNSGDPTQGINIGTIPAGGVVVIAYQAQVVASTGLSNGINSLNNNATITSTEAGTQNAAAIVVVNNSYVAGATTIETGLTNNPVTDSFFLPIFLIIIMSWFYFSGNVYKFSDWLGTKI